MLTLFKELNCDVISGCDHDAGTDTILLIFLHKDVKSIIYTEVIIVGQVLLPMNDARGKNKTTKKRVLPKPGLNLSSSVEAAFPSWLFCMTFTALELRVTFTERSPKETAEP